MHTQHSALHIVCDEYATLLKLNIFLKLNPLNRGAKHSYSHSRDLYTLVYASSNIKYWFKHDNFFQPQKTALCNCVRENQKYVWETLKQTMDDRGLAWFANLKISAQ